MSNTVQNQSKRRNIEDDLFMFMASFGKGTVVAACEEMKAMKI